MMEIGKYSRPCLGEYLNGDKVFLNYENEQRKMVAIIDGLGHGSAAAKMASEVHQLLAESNYSNILDIIEDIHKKMSGKLGAVIGLGVLENNAFTYAGLGNISCKILGEVNKSFTNSHGVLGLRMGSINVRTEYIGKEDLLIMSSDGVSQHLSLDELRKMNYLNANAMAKRVVELYGKNFDDASVIIIRNKDD